MLGQVMNDIIVASNQVSFVRGGVFIILFENKLFRTEAIVSFLFPCLNLIKQNCYERRGTLFTRSPVNDVTSTLTFLFFACFLVVTDTFVFLVCVREGADKLFSVKTDEESAFTAKIIGKFIAAAEWYYFLFCQAANLDLPSLLI